MLCISTCILPSHDYSVFHNFARQNKAVVLERSNIEALELGSTNYTNKDLRAGAAGIVFTCENPISTLPNCLSYIIIHICTYVTKSTSYSKDKRLAADQENPTSTFLTLWNAIGYIVFIPLIFVSEVTPKRCRIGNSPQSSLSQRRVLLVFQSSTGLLYIRL